MSASAELEVVASASSCGIRSDDFDRVAVIENSRTHLCRKAQMRDAAVMGG
jgi:hypothetical protein